MSVDRLPDEANTRSQRRRNLKDEGYRKNLGINPMTNSSSFLQDSNSKRLFIAFVVTVLFMLAEVIGGLISSSLALLADAGHMVTDAMALFIALVAVHFSRRKPNTRHTFGYLRLTTIAAFVNATALLLIVLLIIWEAVHRFIEPHHVLGLPMLVIAVAGFCANLFSFWILHRGTEEKNINVRGLPLYMYWVTYWVL